MSTITAIKAGSEKAFTEVYQQCHVKLHHYFLKKTRSEEIAEELVQISFIKLWNFKHTLNEEIELDAQLFTIARTSLIDFLRRMAVEKQGTVRFFTQTDVASSQQPDAGFESQDYFNKLTHSLPPVRKRIFILSRLQGLTYKEISTHLSISVNTVEDHMSKAIRQLKSLASFFW